MEIVLLGLLGMATLVFYWLASDLIKDAIEKKHKARERAKRERHNAYMDQENRR